MNDVSILRDHQEKLAHAFIEEFLASQGYSMETMGQLPKDEVRQLMVRASIYASTKLALIEDRAELVTSLRHATESLT
jgi:hypothetical protein